MADRDDKKREEQGEFEDGGSAVKELARILLRAGSDTLSRSAERAKDRASTPVKELAGSVKNLTAKSREELLDRMGAEFKRQLEKMDLGHEIRELLTNYALDIQATVRLRRATDGTTEWHVESDGETVASGKAEAVEGPETADEKPPARGQKKPSSRKKN